MILKALYDYYNRCGNLPAPGLEEKEIGFIIVVSKDGKFIRFEDCRIDKKQARTYIVKKHVGRSSVVVANYLYDNSAYVLGYDPKNAASEGKNSTHLLKKSSLSIKPCQTAPTYRHCWNSMHKGESLYSRKLSRIHYGKTSKRICRRNIPLFLSG